MTERIDEKDLGLVSAAPTDELRAVRGGKSVRVPIGSLPPSAAVQAQIDALAAGQAAGQEVYRTWAELSGVTGSAGVGAQVIDDAGTHTDPVVGGTVANSGQYVWSESPAGWRWVRPDALPLKADNTTASARTGSVAVLATAGGDVLVSLDDTGRRRIPLLSMSDGLEMSVRDDLDLPGAAEVTERGGQVVGYRHALGDRIDFLDPPAAKPAAQMRAVSGAAHDRSRIYDAAYNQWIYPTYCGMHGRRWLGSLGNGAVDPEWFGGIAINERVGASTWMQYEFARQQYIQSGYQTDDHNAPCLLLDPRPDAKHPLIVLQADHSGPGSFLRCWRSASPDAAGIGDERTVSMAGNMSYAQAFRNPFAPDEIIAFSRQGGSSSAVWMIYRSTDEFDSVHAARLIGGDDLYMMARPTLDGLGLHIAIQQHPNNGADQRVLYLRYMFADRSLRSWDGDIVAPDAFGTGGFDPFAVSGATEIYAAASGRQKRLFDVRETSLDVIEFLLVDYDKTAWSGDIKHIRLDEGGVPEVSSVGAPGDAGNPIEPSNAQAYFAGLCIAGPHRVIATAWDRVALSSVMRLYASTDDGATWDSTEIATGAGTDQKLIRPTMLTEIGWVGGRIQHFHRDAYVYLTGRYFNFLSFGLDAVESAL